MQVSLPHKLAPFSLPTLDKGRGKHKKRTGGEDRVQNGKMVGTGSNSSSCGQAKSLSHPQFPQLYSELLGPLAAMCRVL